MGGKNGSALCGVARLIEDEDEDEKTRSRSTLDMTKISYDWIAMFRQIGLVAILGVLWIGTCFAEETARDYTTRAVQLVKEGKVNEAMEAFSKAVELAPNYPMYPRNRSPLHPLPKHLQNAVGDD